MVSGKASAQAEIQLLARILQAVIDHSSMPPKQSFSHSNVVQILYELSPKQESFYFHQTDDLLFVGNVSEHTVHP